MFKSAGKLEPGIRACIIAAVADVKTIELKSMASLVVQAEDALQANGNIIYKTYQLNIKESAHRLAECFCNTAAHVLSNR